MKSNTQNAKIEAITEKTLVLGIDVGSETHYARAFDYRGIEYSKKPFKFSNTEAGFVTFKEWILDIKERHEKDKVVLGMEPTGHYWFNLGKFLQDNEMKPVLVNPHHVKKSKELDDNHPTKNDRKDPKVIAGLVREGRVTMDLKAVGQRIKAAREAKNLTQEELAALVNLSPTHVSVIERGLKVTKLDTFIAIANALDVSADTLLIDVVTHSVSGVTNELSEMIEKLPKEKQQRIINAVRALVE